MKILIIDDESFDLFVAKKLLSLEFDVEGFTSLKEALPWINQHEFDVALIDYYLDSNLYAHDALKQIIAVKGNSFKAFVLSNYVDEKQKKELRQSGFAGIINKPITLEKFKEGIKE